MSQVSRNTVSSRGTFLLLCPTLRKRRRPQTFRLRDRRRNGTRSWIHCTSSPFPSNLMAKKVFSFVQPSSHMTIRLYAKRSAHPDILLGAQEMPIPPTSQSGSFCRKSPFFRSFQHIACRYLLYPREWHWGSCAADATSHTLHIFQHHTSEPAQQYTNRR